MEPSRMIRASSKLVFLLSLFFIVSTAAKAAPASEPASAIPALLVSDVHFEPFWDPAKVPQLVAAPVSQWQAILASPASPDQPQRFAALNIQCPVRGEDTTYALFSSSLEAMRAQAPNARFITLSGDLISHSFTCKFNATVPNATPQQHEAFVVKTIQFVLSEFRTTFPNAPLYAALGNNDSGCDDYKIDPNGSFLAAINQAFTGALPANERKAAETSFASEGDFSAALPAPFRNTRILIIDNLFQSKKYQTCSGKDDADAAKAQNAWLRAQLESARKHHEKVWVMGHIPPGIDPFATIVKLKNVCTGQKPTVFLSSDDLANTLADYGDVIPLAIFAHTHMDEMRLFSVPGKAAVPIKMVPSISPVDGNNPSFTIASVDPPTATMLDYRVIVASNKTGVNTEWTQEYDYGQTYHEPAYAAPELSSLIHTFTDDPDVQSPASHAYLHNYYVRDLSLELRLFWPQYSCALSNFTEDGYKACRCAATK
jgi:sphingomyelin phosphodiesterase acid-like 3